jgi:hypothetical protein
MSQHDLIIDDGKGGPVREDIQGALKALASCFAFKTPPPVTYPGMLWLDTSVPPNGQLRMRDQANLNWIAVVGFPVKATSAEAIAGVEDTKYITPKGLADRRAAVPTPPMDYRNRIVNPAMQISQENDVAAGTANGYYPADGWRASTSLTTGAYSIARVLSRTPRGSLHRLRFTVTTVQAAIGTSYILIAHHFEGLRCADFGWGTASAKAAVLRFGFKGPAGTFNIAIRSAANNRAFIKSFVVSAAQANTDIEVTIPVPKTTTGTWATDNTQAFQLYFVLASGYQVGVEGWQDGAFVTAPTTSNGMAALNTFELFDVGLYLDPAATGVPPPWEMPDPWVEMRTCQRYYCAAVMTNWAGSAIITTTYYTTGYPPCEMRVNPTGAGINGGTPPTFAATAGTFAALSPKTIREVRTSTAAGRGYYLTYWDLSARV